MKKTVPDGLCRGNCPLGSQKEIIMIQISLSFINRIIKGREQIVNKTFVKMMDELSWFCCFPGRKEGYCV